MILYLFKAAPVFFGSYHLACIFLADSFGELLCPADLIVFLVIAEAYCKGLVYLGYSSRIA